MMRYMMRYLLAGIEENELMAVAHATSPFITAYKSSDWSKVTDPSELPAGNGQGVAFS